MKLNHLSQLKGSEGIKHYDDISKAILLNGYFTSVFIVDDVFEEDSTASENGI